LFGGIALAARLAPGLLIRFTGQFVHVLPVAACLNRFRTLLLIPVPVLRHSRKIWLPVLQKNNASGQLKVVRGQ
jgi:hypothetical protein